MRAREGWNETEEGGRERERERLEKETKIGRDTETDSDGEGGYVSSCSTETSM